MAENVYDSIRIPEGRFGAQTDYELKNVHLKLAGRKENLKLIKQTFPGNCAEYTTLNTALLISRAGMAINPNLDVYLKMNPSLDLSDVEAEIAIPLILLAQEKHTNLEISGSDLDNIETKMYNPYEPLTNINSAMLFREAISPVTSSFKGNEVLTTYSREVQDRILTQETLAVFVGSRDHATSWIKLGQQCYHIDPYFNSNIVSTATKAEMEESVRESLNQADSFITVNDLYTK